LLRIKGLDSQGTDFRDETSPKESSNDELFFIFGITTLFILGLADKSSAACGENCDSSYSSDMDSCHTQYRDDPEDADDLARCIQGAKDDYDSCVESCRARLTGARQSPTTTPLGIDLTDRSELSSKRTSVTLKLVYFSAITIPQRRTKREIFLPEFISIKIFIYSNTNFVEENLFKQRRFDNHHLLKFAVDFTASQLALCVDITPPC